MVGWCLILSLSGRVRLRARSVIPDKLIVHKSGRRLALLEGRKLINNRVANVSVYIGFMSRLQSYSIFIMFYLTAEWSVFQNDLCYDYYDPIFNLNFFTLQICIMKVTLCQKKQKKATKKKNKTRQEQKQQKTVIGLSLSYASH